MRFFKGLGIVLFSVMLIASVVLFFMRGEATQVSDKAALEAAQAVPQETEPVTAEVTPAPTPAPTATPEPTPTVEPTATPEPTPDPDSPAGRAAALGLPAPPEIDINSWEYTLVNGDNSIGQYVPEQLAYLDLTADSTEIQTAYNGCTVQTYKLKYDKVTKELISKEEDQISKYKKRDKITVSIQVPTEPPTEAPAETPAPEAPADPAA